MGGAPPPARARHGVGPRAAERGARLPRRADAPAGWAATKGGFKYTDSKLLFSPVKSAQIKLARGTFQLQAALLGKTNGIVMVPPNLGTGACVVLEIVGGGRDHVRFPGPPDATIAKIDAKAFQVKKVLAEGLCP